MSDADFVDVDEFEIGDRVMPQNNHRAFRIAIILTDQNVESVFTPCTQIIERK